MNPQAVLDILHSVESGERKVSLRDPLAHCGNVDFLLEDGIIITIYEDEGVWDYVEKIILPDGTHVNFWGEDKERWVDIQKYKPSPETIEDIYGMKAD